MRLMLSTVLVCQASSFLSGKPIRASLLSPWTRFVSGGHRSTASNRCRIELMCHGAGKTKAEDVADEDGVSRHDADQVELLDAETQALIKGLEHGSSRYTSRGGADRRGDLDEARMSRDGRGFRFEQPIRWGNKYGELMKMIMMLRKQMGEEDFYRVFDPRNPRIGDI